MGSGRRQPGIYISSSTVALEPQMFRLLCTVYVCRIIIFIVYLDFTTRTLAGELSSV
jgi:hypothetical protein